MNVKAEYKALLENGELREMYPELSGSWGKDKEKFSALWEQNFQAIRDMKIDFDEQV